MFTCSLTETGSSSEEQSVLFHQFFSSEVISLSFRKRSKRR